jgi:uncharacterized Zn finger protein (UPF0148 family)
MSSEFECTSQEKIIGTARCPTCSKYFNVIEVTHICGVVKCPRPQTTNIEREVTSPRGDIALYECVECETIRIARSSPTLNTCPKCEWEGFYFKTGEGLCPACTAPVLPKNNKKQPRVLKVPVNNQQQAEKQKNAAGIMFTITHMERLDGAESSADTAAVILLKVVLEKCDTDKSIVDNKKIVINTSRNKTTYEQYTQAVTELSNYLKQLRNTYNYYWSLAPNTLDWRLLKYINGKYGGAPNLGQTRVVIYM